MLHWMIVNQELHAFSTNGEVIAKAMLISILSDVEGFKADELREHWETLISANWNSEFCSRMLGKSLYDYIDDEPITWSVDDEPHAISPGMFLWATDVDWEEGVLQGELDGEVISRHEEWFWGNDELLASGFAKADFVLRLEGLSFRSDAIELLQPSSEGVVVVAAAPKSSARIGRPPRWNWEGAMAAMVAAAQHPDGLPTGPGAQAQIEKMMADWFVTSTGDSPAPSQIRQKASGLVGLLRKAD